MYNEYLNMILKSESPNVNESFKLASSMLSGELSDNQIASLLTALKIKGEGHEVIAGFSKALKHHSLGVLPVEEELIDVCGTGGDGSNSFNISTTVSFVLAASGLTVAKHGNRSISSKSGSADVLKELGISFNTSADEHKRDLENNRFTFLFAPLVHPNMKYVMPVRTDLKIPTIFNIIGPLCNPYKLDYQVIGVYKEELLLKMAKAVQVLGIKRAAIVHGHGGMDELSLSGKSKVVYVIDNEIISDTVDPMDYSINYSDVDNLKGGDAKENASITLSVLEGMKGPKQDVVALNAGLALFIAKKVKTLAEGVSLAFDLLNSSKVKAYLESITEKE